MRRFFAGLLCVALASCSRPAIDSAHSDPSALPNLLEARDGVWIGGDPGAGGFDALAAMGVRTIVSVDGASPDVERARAHGLRYVHVPLVYSGVGRGDAAQLAKALRDLPEPVYVHCHHGSHRAPAAGAVGLIAIGAMTREDGLALLERAGTSRSYPGLWEAVGDANELDAEMIDSAELVETAAAGTLAQRMSEIDRAWSNLEHIRAAGWRTPTDHPDLVPASEAGRMVELLRGARLQGEPEEMTKWMRDATATAASLEQVLARGETGDAAQHFQALGRSCASCHRVYRD